MNSDLVSMLMTNNDHARELAMKLNQQVIRLKQRELELIKRIQLVFDNKQQEKTKEENEFLEWLLLFRLETDENNNKQQEQQQSEPIDSREATYKQPIKEEEESIKRCIQLKEELKLLSRLRRKAYFPFLESREISNENQINEWEKKFGVKLPPQLAVLFQIIGGNAIFRNHVNSVQIHSYSPLLALLPLNSIGWTEVWGGEDDPDEYLDDLITADILKHFDIGHEFDDSFVCDQLCGKKNRDGRVRVLLIGAPINVKVNNNNNVVNSRMFLNIRPGMNGDFVGDGLLYRLDCSISREEGDSELIKIGTPFEWLESSFLEEVDERYERVGEGDPILKRYPKIFESKHMKLSEDA